MRNYNYIQTEEDFQCLLSSINARFNRAHQLSEEEFERLSNDVDACTEIRIRIMRLQK